MPETMETALTHHWWATKQWLKTWFTFWTLTASRNAHFWVTAWVERLPWQPLYGNQMWWIVLWWLTLPPPAPLGHKTCCSTLQHYSHWTCEQLGRILTQIKPYRRTFQSVLTCSMHACDSMTGVLLTTWTAIKLCCLLAQDAGVRQFFLTNLKRSKAGEYHWKCYLDGIAESMQQLKSFPVFTKPFTGHTLFVGGSNSHYITYVTATLHELCSTMPQHNLWHYRCLYNMCMCGTWGKYVKYKNHMICVHIVNHTNTGI